MQFLPARMAALSGPAEPQTAKPDPMEAIGSALGLAMASGLSLYGAAFVVGLAIQLGWLTPGPGWHGLQVLADPLVLALAGVLFAIEFLADKIPWVDSAWDAVHTVIRPIGGALLCVVLRVDGGDVVSVTPEGKRTIFSVNSESSNVRRKACGGERGFTTGA